MSSFHRESGEVNPDLINWPPADVNLDVETDPDTWGGWADDYRFVPTADDSQWAAEHLNASDRVGASMIDPALGRALASGRLTQA